MSDILSRRRMGKIPQFDSATTVLLSSQVNTIDVAGAPIDDTRVVRENADAKFLPVKKDDVDGKPFLEMQRKLGLTSLIKVDDEKVPLDADDLVETNCMQIALNRALYPAYSSQPKPDVVSVNYHETDMGIKAKGQKLYWTCSLRVP
jgi:hypothetical protein